MNNSYPPEDDISVMAARTPTAIIAKVNANSFSKIDMAENALISVLGCFCKRVKLFMRSTKEGRKKFPKTFRVVQSICASSTVSLF